MFWLFAQMFVLCAFAFLAGAVLTWLPLRATIRNLRAERAPRVVRAALPATAVIIPEQPHGQPYTDDESHLNGHQSVNGHGPSGQEPNGQELNGYGQNGWVEAVEVEPADGGVAEATTPLVREPSPVREMSAAERAASPEHALPGVAKIVVPQGSSGDVGFEVKGSSKSMIFHTPDSPYFKRMKGDVTFRSVEEAEQAGYTQWRPKSAATSAR